MNWYFVTPLDRLGMPFWAQLDPKEGPESMIVGIMLEHSQSHRYLRNLQAKFGVSTKGQLDKPRQRQLPKLRGRQWSQPSRYQLQPSRYLRNRQAEVGDSTQDHALLGRPTTLSWRKKVRLGEIGSKYRCVVRIGFQKSTCTLKLLVGEILRQQ